MKVDANFDGGNIIVVDVKNPDNIRLKIRKDSQSDDHCQWFYFRLTGGKSTPCQFSIVNADQATYPEAWPTCTLVTSHDRQNWTRLSTQFKDRQLQFSLTPATDVVYVALFAPYSYERHQDLIAWSLSQRQCELFASYETPDNHQIEILKIAGAAQAPKSVWIIARQHPAETMAEWFMEGLLEALLGEERQLHQSVLATCNFYLVANMNPDGSVAGNLRTNGMGIDLNRAWLNPDKQQAPESHFVLQHMANTGVDLFLDIHGDEDVPFAFIQGCEGIPSYNDALQARERQFKAELAKASGDFCVDDGYPACEPNEAPLNIAGFQIGARFNCLSLTLEMPFTDNKYRSDAVSGWSPQRSKLLGKHILAPIKSLFQKT
ncbi:M14 family metallopeptidase [Paraglaciecola polaris]|uniref:Peptidase M14 domain-containing protein n=2 Tax=Paraglaciecola polaris TaxID=222814 RepID=K6YPD2_9ALTE|nr:M14-type cytosolic carboxypeptidase [Paraglaciecola polaris]GAC34589.1 hypothetical protein GPLA_3704 [Paraglaciecola polaris LMG 21857]